MRKCVCTESFEVQMCNENGFLIDSEIYVKEGTEFEISDLPNRVVGGSDSIRLSNAKLWLEIDPDTFSTHFKEVSE